MINILLEGYNIDASWLYDELKKRGIQPGKDIAVLGYDDTILAAKSYPSLSSVKADPIALGARSIRLIMDMIQGEEVTSEVLPTQFVRRDSFRSVSMAASLTGGSSGECVSAWWVVA